MRILRKTVEYLLTGLVVLALVIIVAWFTVPRFFGYEPQVVLSGSMEPTLDKGGIVLVKHRDGTDVKVGDKLTYRHPERPASERILVTHRVVEVEETANGVFYTTRGDANDGNDPWVVLPEHVIGTVEWHTPYVGYAAQWGRSRLGLAILVGIPVMILGLGEIRNVVNELRSRKKSPVVGGSES